jgi:hypothetical protein
MPEITTSHGGEIEEDWYPELEQLPERPRRKLLTPSIVLLALVLFAACGFIGGVLVQKGQGSSGGGAGAGTGASTFASRFGAAASGASGASGTAGSGFASRFAGVFGGGAGGGTAGTVSSISGKTLYVTETSGNTVAVVTTPESKIKKSQSVSAGAIHPGDSVVVEGITGSTGTVVASSVTDSGASTTSTSSSSSTASGVSSLFGGG